MAEVVILVDRDVPGGAVDAITSAARDSAVKGEAIVMMASALRTLPDLESTIANCQLVVADISRPNQSIAYCVGLAVALKKPIVLVASRQVNMSLDSMLPRFHIMVYRDEDPKFSRFERFLPSAIRDALKNPVAHVTGIKDAKDGGRVFISYSHADREYLDRLLVHLKPLEDSGSLDHWADTRLRGGDKGGEAIHKALSPANAAILLVSADFIASDFIRTKEIPPLLAKAKNEGTRIVPIIVAPSRFLRYPALNQFMAVNDASKPLSTFHFSDCAACLV